jgi:hypothetical protein
MLACLLTGIFSCMSIYMPSCYICLLQIVSLVSVCMSAVLCKISSGHVICRLICQTSIMPNSMSLHMSIVVSTTILESVCQLTCQVQYLLICQILYPICYVLYAGCHMPRLVCRFIYVECHVLAVASLQSDQFICLSQYQFLHALG